MAVTTVTSKHFSRKCSTICHDDAVLTLTDICTSNLYKIRRNIPPIPTTEYPSSSIQRTFSYIGDVLSSRGNYTDNLLRLLKTRIKLPHAWVQIEKEDTLTFSVAKQRRMIPRNRKEFEYSNSLLNFHPRLMAPCHQNLIALGL